MRYAFSVDRIGACALKSFTAVAGENRTTCELLWARKEDLASERPVKTCGVWRSGAALERVSSPDRLRYPLPRRIPHAST